ncbi:hypothetical protein [Streptomyces atratus]|uniref:Uncharacterized protein n=1 Tax=Streptomyces atratus TaxID=1893 RepID=A0A2Z5JPL0_STRAR|nr:hypothetical protein [Streptomyces atratus]AXE82238.1 hypothetical protein C5746_41340 [Streptomyces atratus]
MVPDVTRRPQLLALTATWSPIEDAATTLLTDLLASNVTGLTQPSTSRLETGAIDMARLVADFADRTLATG